MFVKFVTRTADKEGGRHTNNTYKGFAVYLPCQVPTLGSQVLDLGSSLGIY